MKNRMAAVELKGGRVRDRVRDVQGAKQIRLRPDRAYSGARSSPGPQGNAQRPHPPVRTAGTRRCSSASLIVESLFRSSPSQIEIRSTMFRVIRLCRRS